MNTRRANFARSILALGVMFGGMPVGFGVPHPRLDPLPPLLLSTNAGVPPPPEKRQLRPLAERKARRAKRKQRRQR